MAHCISENMNMCMSCVLHMTFMCSAELHAGMYVYTSLRVTIACLLSCVWYMCVIVANRAHRGATQCGIYFWG